VPKLTGLLVLMLFICRKCTSAVVDKNFNKKHQDRLRRKSRRALAVLMLFMSSCMGYLPARAGTPYRRSEYLIPRRAKRAGEDHTYYGT